MFSGHANNRLRLTLAIIFFAMICGRAASALPQARAAVQTLPRTADGKPDFQGIWQVRNKAASDLLQEKGIVQGGSIPYLTAAAAKQKDNLKNRKTADPLEKCFFPGVPRIMYLEYPFQIF